MFSKILIANRGEIAIRIIRAAKEMGISSVAVFSEADSDSLHISLADESICIGPPPVGESYLNMHAIIAAALATKAEAIHPGYGLLSENGDFAALCQKHNLVFIGPSPEIIHTMGDKDAARKAMAEAGVPIVPGSGILKNEEEAKITASRLGFPLLLKAKAGGGGRGIRLINDESQLGINFASAAREAQAAFGDGSLYFEKYISPAKHVEIQILCDNQGGIICLGERECSVQRKRQKLVEESPSPGLSGKLRKEMIEAAYKAAKASGYINAGTVEFLVAKDGSFYFMEMNTRLQVEHTVTEMVTGIDIVKWQIRIAAGIALPFTQKDIKIAGHAIECRINAENPQTGFTPSCGRVTLLHIPGGPWVRFDTALYQGYFIPPFYDSLIGKLIVFAKTREEAIRKMQAALCELVIEGINHNAELQMNILDEEEFHGGDYYTDFMEKRGNIC